MEFIAILYILLLIFLCIVPGWRIFSRAGKPGWAIFIPIYNIIVLLDIVGKPWWWLLLMLIPIVNIVISIMVTHLLAKSFGKGVGFTIGLILLGFIFFPILGYGNAPYNKPA
ncbi:MAG TPA: DUF5684 domain-containing protein [Spirochaetota bacterium]|nr:DUF5684 domain-containing protein [Spirochaetota bacterium]